MFDKLNWGREGLEKIIDQLLLNYSNVVLINDIDRINDNNYFKKNMIGMILDQKKII